MKVATNTAKILRNVPLPDEVAVTHRNAAVVDIGSCVTRMGFAGDDFPRFIQRTCTSASGDGEARAFDEAYARRAEETPDQVLNKGNVINWDGMETILQRIDDVFALSHEEHSTPLLLSEKAFVAPEQRQRIAEILFERHSIASVYFSHSPVLSLYASGECTGLSIDVGFQCSQVVPVFQGFSLFHATYMRHSGGDNATRFLQDNNPELPSVVAPEHRYDVWEYIKEKACQTCPDKELFNRTIENAADEKYTHSLRLPDGTEMRIGSSRFIPAEALLDPSLMAPDEGEANQADVTEEVFLRTYSGVRGIHQLGVDAIKRCDHDLLHTFCDNVLLSGGGSLYPGLPDRVGNEMKSLLPAVVQRVQTVAMPERRHAAFIGGSILASMPVFQDLWVSKAEYDEVGSRAVMRNCF